MADQTLAQLRAADALAKIEELRSSNNYGNYVSYAKALPATILTNGLGQAAATLLAGQKKPGNAALYQHLEGWLCRDAEQAPYRGASSLVRAITQHDQNRYFQAQAEALAWLEWLKKFAVAFLKEEERE